VDVQTYQVRVVAGGEVDGGLQHGYRATLVIEINENCLVGHGLSTFCSLISFAALGTVVRPL
jgi:hypothetical protein